jgi:hypothetical protein
MTEMIEDAELVSAADGLDHVASALTEVHALSGIGDDATFDASMFGQIAAVERGASLLRRAAIRTPDPAKLREALELVERVSMREDMTLDGRIATIQAIIKATALSPSQQDKRL